MNTKLKIYLKLFLFSTIIICSTTTQAEIPEENMADCDCCGETYQGYGNCCSFCESSCPCDLCGACYKNCPCHECGCTGCSVSVAGDHSKCPACRINCNNCGRCKSHNCHCNPCDCCGVMIEHGSGTRCSACTTLCGECGSCVSHGCNCNPDDPPGGDEGGGGGGDFDVWINIKIYDNDGIKIPFERDHPNYNETSPGAFVMQTFEENGTIDESKMNKLYFDGDIDSYDETDEQIKIERINDKIKLWKARREYINDEWVTIEKRPTGGELFGSSNSKTFSAEDFFNDIQYKQFWVEGVEPGVSGIKTYSANEFDDEVKITVYGGTDLTIHNGGSDLDNGESLGPQGTVVPDSDEENVGAYLLVNWDDDDADGTFTTENGWVADPVPDLQENFVANEDNLAKLDINIVVLPPEGTYELEVVSSANKIKLWVTSTKNFEIPLSSNNKKTWDMTSTYDKSELQNYINNGIWIEGIEASDFERDVEIVLRYYDDNGIEKLRDTIKATVVMLNLGAGLHRSMATDWEYMAQRGHAALLTKFNGTCTPADFRNSSLYTVHEMQATPNCCITPTWKTFHDAAVYWNEYGFRITYIKRLKILQTAKWVESRKEGNLGVPAGEGIKYAGPEDVLEHDNFTWDGTLIKINTLRCDGLIEFCYEWNDLDVWGKIENGNSNYSIVNFTSDHNWMNYIFYWYECLYPATQSGHESRNINVYWHTMFNPIDIIKPNLGSITW